MFSERNSKIYFLLVKNDVSVAYSLDNVHKNKETIPTTAGAGKTPQIGI